MLPAYFQCLYCSYTFWSRSNWTGSVSSWLLCTNKILNVTFGRTYDSRVHYYCPRNRKQTKEPKFAWSRVTVIHKLKRLIHPNMKFYCRYYQWCVVSTLLDYFREHISVKIWIKLVPLLCEYYCDTLTYFHNCVGIHVFNMKINYKKK